MTHTPSSICRSGVRGLRAALAVMAVLLLAPAFASSSSDTSSDTMPDSIRSWRPAFSSDGDFLYRPYRGKRYVETFTAWHEDILPGYEARYVNMGEAYDGPCRCTVVRRMASSPTGRAVLYVHGFNDYFFQREMGERYVDSGYNFYAVDLRRYGRSMLPWQYPFDVRDFREYICDIDSALAVASRDGNTDITLIGHSTGGLTVFYYATVKGARCGVRRVVGDSPFLSWNFPAFYRKVLIPLVSAWGKIAPGGLVKQSHCDAYSQSLLRRYHGEWDYDTCWKMVYSPPVKTGWISAVTSAQREVMHHARRNITVPGLVLHSSRRYESCGWDSTCMTADIVLDPFALASCASRMGPRVTAQAVDSGIHDLILSPQPHRDRAYELIFRFMGDK